MELKVIELNENKTAFLLQKGELIEVNVTKIIYEPSESLTLHLKDVIVEHQDKEIVTKCCSLYQSFDAFTQGQSLQTKLKYFNDKFKGYYWDNETKQPEYYDAIKRGYRIIYDLKTNELNVDGFLPEDLFPFSDDVRKYYPINVQKLDGTTEIHGGVLSKLMLNEEEMELVEVFKKCLRKMKEHNISFVRVDDKSYVFKSDKIKYYSCWGDQEHNVTFLNKFRVKELEWDEGVNKGDWCDGLSVEFK